MKNHLLTSLAIPTRLGEMMAFGDEETLHALIFVDEVHKKYRQMCATPGMTAPLQSIQSELAQYFEGTLHTFATPLCFDHGTAFQQSAWRALQQIPYGQTRAYVDMACMVGKPTAFRAVANANGANPISIVVPCHRVIHRNGALGGYAGGVARKEWLLAHERLQCNMTKSLGQSSRPALSQTLETQAPN